MFEGRTLFSGQDPDGKGYSTRAHLAEMIALLGRPPADFIKRGNRSSEFFDEDGSSLIICTIGAKTNIRIPGNWRSTVSVPAPVSLEGSEENFAGERKELFLNFVKSMLQWVPEHRKTAKELLEDHWLNDAIE